ncbi:MAG: diaminopimelate decarboxylase [Syntrophaceae bacterium]
MNDFHYRDGELWCEEVPVRELAEKAGTPLYVYSHRTLKRHFQVFDNAFAGMKHIICFSVKANSNIAILRLFMKEGGGADIVSGGELFRALQAGADPGRIVYSGVGKKRDEIEFAIRSNILMFNVESSQELEAINAAAGKLGAKARISIRINPDVDPKTHPHISTGLKKNKFGIDIQKSLEEYRRAREFKNVEIIGVDCHIGSQVTQISPFVDALEKLKKFISLLKKDGIEIKYLDLGGGLGITYNQETPPHPDEYADAIRQAADGLDCTFILEPGRVIVGNAGALVSRVLFTKSNEEKNFIIVDAGMNDLIRPSFYDSFHRIISVVPNRDEQTCKADIVGPICESGDFLAKDRAVPAYRTGDLIAVMSAGAYGFTMSSNYNSRPRAAEVMVKDDKFFVIRRREEYQDLVRGEEIPDFLK